MTPDSNLVFTSFHMENHHKGLHLRSYCSVISGILIKKFIDHQPYFLCLKTIKHKKPPTEIKLVKDQAALFTQKIFEDINTTNIIGKLYSGHGLKRNLFILMFSANTVCETSALLLNIRLNYRDTSVHSLMGIHRIRTIFTLPALYI